jgi:hypothetical protein
MKVEIINKPMLCWDNNEENAREYHVLAKVTECSSNYPYKVIYNKNTCPEHPEWAGGMGGGMVDGWGFKHAKEPQQEIELTLDEIADKFGISVEQLKIKK